MQVIIAFSGDPDDYARQDAQLRIARPRACPNCGKPSGLRALGYYSRWVSSSNRGKPTSIMVRRFRCPCCHLTTSMLPDFAQPYRLVATDTVDVFLAGTRSGDAVNVWFSLLQGYQRRFEVQLPETRQVLSSAYSLTALSEVAVDLWEEIRRHFGPQAYGKVGRRDWHHCFRNLSVSPSGWGAKGPHKSAFHLRKESAIVMTWA